MDMKRTSLKKALATLKKTKGSSKRVRLGFITDSDEGGTGGGNPNYSRGT
jgi:hypothetical protein